VPIPPNLSALLILRMPDPVAFPARQMAVSFRTLIHAGYAGFSSQQVSRFAPIEGTILDAAFDAGKLAAFAIFDTALGIGQRSGSCETEDACCEE